MFVNFSQTLTVAATQQDAWNLLRDPKRMASLLPNVESIAEGDSQEKFLAHVVERVGPFRLSLNLEVKIVDAAEPFLLQAELTGTDSRGQNRLSGTLRAELKEDSTTGTLISMDSAMEVTGALATLGAAPIRRRANEIFAQFAERLQRQF
jgi:carbon monoxide dehydrogenase subunit G